MPAKYKKRKGMKIGGKHHWKYHTKPGDWKETKIAPGLWKISYYQTKGRKGYHAKKGQGFPKGGKLHWYIKAHQYAIKTGPNTYKVHMTGYKKQIGWKPPKTKKWR